MLPDDLPALQRGDRRDQKKKKKNCLLEGSLKYLIGVVLSISGVGIVFVFTGLSEMR